MAWYKIDSLNIDSLNRSEHVFYTLNKYNGPKRENFLYVCNIYKIS